MPAPFEEISTITAKGQTTVPKAVRKALGLDDGGRLVFRVDGDGVALRRVEADEPDPAITVFLAFLARDLERRPEAVTSLDPDLAAHLGALTSDVDVDLDAPIEGKVAL